MAPIKDQGVLYHKYVCNLLSEINAMRSLYLFPFMCFWINSSSGQITNRGNGNFYTTFNRASDIPGTTPEGNQRIAVKEGTPFFQNEWAKGSLLAPDRKAYQNIPVKINLLENNIHYLDSTGRELVIGVPISEIILEQPAKAAPAHFINGYMLPNPKTGWYLLLVNDTVSLVKGFTKFFNEHIAYGTAPEYSIETQETYTVYFYYRGFSVSKISDLIRIFPSKKAEIEHQIKTIDERLPKDEQFSLIVNYCNTLSGLNRF